MRPITSLSLILTLFLCSDFLQAQQPDVYRVGFARVDITPDYPIRLNGFGNRREESDGVSQQLFARAMAISQGEAPPLVLVAIDNLGVRITHVDEAANRLNRSHQLPRENFALTFTHTHCAPKVTGASDNIFSEAIPDAHQKSIDRYTEEIVEAITTAAGKAIDSRQPSRLDWSIGNVGFAKNRRPSGGPVDHDLPTLIIRDVESDAVRGVYVSYACHCVTLRFNKISGDWAGYAAEMIERQFPGAVALVSIGAGSDQNPSEVTPDDTQIAQRQGTEIASEVKRLADEKQWRVHGPTKATFERIDLPLNALPTRQQFAETVERGGRATDRYNAATQIAKLDRGEALLTAIDYPIQTWSFGDTLCVTFLAGEVCVDYSLRLKTEFDRQRFWLNAYSNDFCSYIPSERLVKEGGYGGGGEVPYFALPATLAAGLEQRIVDQVHRQVPANFVVPEGVQGVAPKSPQQSLECMRTHDELQISIAAAEPSIRDPVAIDFGIDGCLWVAEMTDYGRGVYEQFEQTGRIRCLRDDDGDGVFDTATTFVEGLRFPTDVKVWRDGLLICDAPDILLARDTSGDGKADQIDKLFSGFEVRNAQARVNSLRVGLDNWVHGSCGLFGGEILSHKTGVTTSLVGRDFRMNPDSGEIEAVAGRTQQGRCRNDWGDWFGCSNGSLLRHYASDDRYLRRNPFVSVSSPAGLVGSGDAYRMYPPQDLVRFELSGAPGVATAACGLEIYRDVLMGDEYFDSAFTCEPVNQLVHRIKLSQLGLSYQAERGTNEANSEFLSSTDRWFRPVQARTGPDGALWVVDMYRYVIEHSRWIPPSTLAELDVYAGQRMGRLYRVTSRQQSDSGLPNLQEKSNDELAELLRSTNGTLRDLAHQLLVWRKASDTVPAIRNLAKVAPLPQSRIQALAVLDALQALDGVTLLDAMRDRDANVVQHALRLSEPMLAESEPVRSAVLSLASHSSPRVRRQVAWSLGESRQDDVLPVLAAMASHAEPDAHVRSAVLTAIHSENAGPLLHTYVELPRQQQSSLILREIVKSAVRLGDVKEIEEVVSVVLRRDQKPDAASFALLAEALNAADARIGEAKISFASETQDRVRQWHDLAGRDLDEGSLALLGRHRGRATQWLLSSDPTSSTSIRNVIDSIGELVTARQSVARQLAAIEAVARTGNPDVSDLLLDRYRQVNFASQQAILDTLLSRSEWTSALLQRISAGEIGAAVLGAERRTKLLLHADESIRSRASEVLGMKGSPSRAAIVDAYQEALQGTGDGGRGRELYRKHCASCHKMEGDGHDVGPELQALTNRDPSWLLTAILDPNRDLDARYVSWSAVSEDGRLIAGLVVEESASTIRLREAGGKEHELLRQEIEQFRASNVSLMPEGFEKEMTTRDIRDLIAYVSQVIGQVSSAKGNADTALPRHAPQIAPFLLDDSQSIARRQSAIDQRPGMGPGIVALLVQDLRIGDEETQYERMPWIWRVSLAVGKRNDGGEIRDLLEESLPENGQPLQHWQAVVVGGGIINGLTQVDQWPGRRIASILDGAPSLRPRWQRAISLAEAMADNPQVRPGTRYDALRMIALAEPSKAVAHLRKYLPNESDQQLQMGAVSGLADIESPAVIPVLIESLPSLSDRNRQLAIAGLLRSDARSDALQQAIAMDRKLLRSDELRPLLDHSSKTISANAARLMTDSLDGD